MNIKQQYLAFELTPASKARLIQQFKPRYDRVICGHITVAFNLTEESCAVLTEELSRAKLFVEGWAALDGVQCLVVNVNGSTKRPDGKVYHITVSLGEGHKPVESNALLAQHGWNQCPAVPFEAELKLLNK